MDFGHVYIYLRPVHQQVYLLNTYLSSLDLSFVSILFDYRNSKIITVYGITMFKNTDINCDVVRLLKYCPL